MKTDDELRNELNALSDDALAIAEELCEIFKRFPAIETGEAEVEYSGLLFI